jgi:hypothetical protein
MDVVQGFEPVLHFIWVRLDTSIAQATVRNAQGPAWAYSVDAAGLYVTAAAL